MFLSTLVCPRLKRKPSFAYFKAMFKDGTVKEYPYPPTEAGAEDELSITEFIDCVLGNAKPRNDYDYAEEMLATMGTAYLSEKNGRAEVTIDEFKKHCAAVAAGKVDPEEQIRAVIADITSTIM
jgi:hypothetical protein